MPFKYWGQSRILHCMDEYPVLDELPDEDDDVLASSPPEALVPPPPSAELGDTPPSLPKNSGLRPGPPPKEKYPRGKQYSDADRPLTLPVIESVTDEDVQEYENWGKRPGAAGSRVYRQSVEDLKQQFLELYANGGTVEECMAQLDRSRQAYTFWRKNDPLFAAYSDQIRVARWKKTKNSPTQYTNDAASFGQFVSKYFPDRGDPYPQQLAMVDTLVKVGIRDIAMFLIWPEARKTGTIEDYICWQLALDPNHRFRIISQSQQHSRRMIDFLKHRMTDTSVWRDYIARWGPFYEKGQERFSKPWHADQFTVAQSTGEERDRSVVASSWSSATYGSRIDTLIVDDVCALENVNLSENILRRIQGTFWNRGIEMKSIIVGTRIEAGDVYERIMDAGLLTRPPIIWNAATPTGDPKVPEFWDREIYHDGNACCRGFREDTCPRDKSKLTPREFMELIRHQVGESSWWSSYMQSPTANPLSTFASFLPPDSEFCCDFDRAVGVIPA